MFCALWFQISDTLKRFAVKVTTASVKERREILSELGKCISGKGKSSGALFCLPGWRRLFISKGCVRVICLREGVWQLLEPVLRSRHEVCG